MLTTKDKDSSDKAFHSCLQFCSDAAENLQYLEDIHNSPNYYAQWWLSQQEGHLMYKGLVALAENHSSVYSRLGKGEIFL